MCNKCETVAPATPLLAHWAEVKKSIIIIKKNRMKAVMQDALNQHHLINARSWHHSRYKINGDYQQDQAKGHTLAKHLAVANKLASRDATTLEDFNPISEYFTVLYNAGYSLRGKVEPSLAIVGSNMSNGVWEEVDVISKLHPYPSNGGDGDYHSYENAQKGFRVLNQLHRIHISTDDINQIAYYPTLKHMREGREVRTRLGRYLTKYQQAFNLTDSDVKSMAEKHASIMRSRGGWTVEFIAHNDEDGWLRVYDSPDVSSCMQSQRSVRIYAHEKSVLRLAYVKAGDKIIARCIVRDDDKGGWLRVYPDQNGYAEGRFLMDYLKSNGYDKQTNLDGVLLQYIDTGRGIVCPYIDYGSGGDQSVGVVTHGGVKYLLAGGSGYSACETDGYVNDDTCSCDMCGDRVDEDDTTYIEHSQRTVCDDCRDNNYTYAYGRRHEDYFPEDECIEVNDTWYWGETLAYHDIYECEHTGEFYHIDDMTNTYDGLFHMDYVVSVDRHTEWEYVYQNNVHTLSDGTTCHEDDADKYEADIAEALAEETAEV